jgi:Subtilisin-like serine proteases
MNSVRERLQLPENVATGSGVRIAILDTGVDPDHPDLVHAIDLASSKSFARLSSDILDRHYHGTHIAGIIAGNGAASGGKYKGIAPESHILALKVATDDRMEAGAVADALAAAIEARVDIINYSASFSPAKKVGAPPWIWSHRSLLEDVFEEATSKGILCVVAAGNDGLYYGKSFSSTTNRPGGSSELLTVGATTADDRVSQLSSRGPHLISRYLRAGGVERYDGYIHKEIERRPKPDLVAPGENIIAPLSSHSQQQGLESIVVDERYIPVTGTSQATAVVTGLAACLLQVVRDRKIALGPESASYSQGDVNTRFATAEGWNANGFRGGNSRLARIERSSR